MLHPPTETQGRTVTAARTAAAVAADASLSIDDDPYVLDSSAIREPPTGWGASMRYLGPGLILSASIVGSGELIATTTAGAQAGFVLLWLVLFSCAVKVAVQIEFARWNSFKTVLPAPE
jgi:hypothetical protein